ARAVRIEGTVVLFFLLPWREKVAAGRMRGMSPRQPVGNALSGVPSLWSLRVSKVDGLPRHATEGVPYTIDVREIPLTPGPSPSRGERRIQKPSTTPDRASP